MHQLRTDPGVGDSLSTARSVTTRYRFGTVPGIVLINLMSMEIPPRIIVYTYIRIIFLVDAMVPQDFANFLTSEDHLRIPSSFGGL